MYKHLLVHRFKIIVRDKELLFWTLLFPFILATFFNLAFSKLNENEKFEPIPIAIVIQQEEENSYLKQALKIVSEGEDKLFELQELKEEEAKQKLEDKEIKGYLLKEKLYVKEEGLEQTIIKSFLDQYYQKESTIQSIIEFNKGNITPQQIQSLFSSLDYIQKESYSKENPDSTVNYFYTLIAMTCLYGGFWGVKEIRDIQANQSPRACRINLAPTHKGKVILANVSAAFFVNFVSVILLLIYLMFGLKIDFGQQIGNVLLTCMIGCMVGISLGMVIGVVCKKGEKAKTAILLAVTMTCSFLAGMMYIDMKYIVHSKIPILGYLNPANLLTDALYSLYYFDTLERFWLNIFLLTVLTIGFLTITYGMIRRQKYESI